MSGLGRFRAIRQLASGGMGDVFLAEDTAPPQGAPALVAIKRAAAPVASDPELLRLFRHEAQLLTSLSHRHIVRVYEVGEDEQGCFVVMELVEGPSLRHLMQRLTERGLRLPPALAMDIAAQVGDALAFAYYARDPKGRPLRIIHRDVSPRNILVSRSGEVKLIDFGIAQSLRRAVGPGAGVGGKVGYSSPEQLAGEPLNARSDLFSLGTVLCEMLSGRHPFERASLEGLAQAIRREPPQLPSASAPELALCDPVLLRLLAKHPSDRFADGLEIAKELGKLREQIPAPPERLDELVCAAFGVEPGAELEPCPQGSPGADLPAPAGMAGRTAENSHPPRPAPAPIERLSTLCFFPSLQAQPHCLPETTTDPQFPWIEQVVPGQDPSARARPPPARPSAEARDVPHLAGCGPAQAPEPDLRASGMIAGWPEGASEARAEPAAQAGASRPAVIYRFAPRQRRAGAQASRFRPPPLPAAPGPGPSPTPLVPAVAGDRAAPIGESAECPSNGSQGLAGSAAIASAQAAASATRDEPTDPAASSPKGLLLASTFAGSIGEPIAPLDMPAAEPSAGSLAEAPPGKPRERAGPPSPSAEAPLESSSATAGEPVPERPAAAQAADAQAATPAGRPSVPTAEAPADSSLPLAPTGLQLGKTHSMPTVPGHDACLEGSAHALGDGARPGPEPAELESKRAARGPRAPAAPRPAAAPVPARRHRGRGWRSPAVLALAAAAGVAMSVLAGLRGLSARRQGDGAARLAESSPMPPATAAAPEPAVLPAAALALAAPVAPPPGATTPPPARPAPPKVTSTAPPLRRPSSTWAKQAEAYTVHKPTARREEPAPRLARADSPPQLQAPAAEPAALEARKTTFRLSISGPGAPVQRALSGSSHIQLLEAAGVAVFLTYRAEASSLQASLTSEPWTIVAVDGVSVGKTPVALPDLAQRRMRIELRRPGADPISFELLARPEP